MALEQLIAYISAERARGVSDDAIRGALLSEGWRVEDVNAGLMGFGADSGSAGFSFAGLYRGRLGRMQYFLTTLFYGLIVLVAMGLALSVLYMSVSKGNIFHGDYWAALFFAFIIVVVITVLALPLLFSLIVRRLHDIGWSGLFALLMFIPFVNFISTLVILFMPGTSGPNPHGSVGADRSFLHTLLNTF